MIPYSQGLILDNASNYGLVKTEAVFGFGKRPTDLVQFNDTGNDGLDWMITPVAMERSLAVPKSKALKTVANNPSIEDRQLKKIKKNKSKKMKRKGKVKKCVFKILKKQNKRGKRKSKRDGMKKKYLLPMVLGLLAAKSVLVPIALKALAFMSAKGFLMGFFSTILASFLSLKGMFDHGHRYQDRKDEKTQVEIIQLPAKQEHHYDEHEYYRKADFVPGIDPYIPLDGHYLKQR